MKKLNLITILLAVFIVLMGCKKECTFIYSSWTSCTNNIQTRTYTSSPSGCTGTPPADSIQRQCITPCVFVYSSWSVCSNNIQTRTYNLSPSGCTGTPPADSIQRQCITPCVFVYSSWSVCSNNIQTRTYTPSPSGCTGTPPADSIQRSCIMLITIGNQTWSSKNLDIATYRNGDPIPEVQDKTAWANLNTGAWCYYANNTSNGIIYGKLYNWYAVNDPRGLAPIGFHIPSDSEWTTLTTYLGGEPTAGGKMKEAGTSHWSSPNTGATNSSGFTGLPGGKRIYNGDFSDIGAFGSWWSSSESNSYYAWSRKLAFINGNALRADYTKEDGLSVRCVKD